MISIYDYPPPLDPVTVAEPESVGATVGCGPGVLDPGPGVLPGVGLLHGLSVGVGVAGYVICTSYSLYTAG